ncbi:TPA: hypothetical protein ACOEOW_003918 [Enterobacter hormaechei subsp. xiangfangensis]
MATTERRFMDKQWLQEEAGKYGCEVVHFHHRRKVIMLKKGERWTTLLDSSTGKPIQRLREVSIEDWREAIKKGAEYLDSDTYK